MSKRRLRVYIAGPLSGSGDRLENVKRAVDVGKTLIKQGFAPLIPHLTHYVDPDDALTHAVWLDVDLPWVEVADALLRLPGESKGADMEVREALRVGVPVFESVHDLLEATWLVPGGRWQNDNYPLHGQQQDAPKDAYFTLNDSGERRAFVTGFTVNDSGERRAFGTGSVRDTRTGKGRFDLISPIALKRLALHYEAGAKKYGDRNWEKGQPLSVFLDSALRHLNCFLAGQRDEDHMTAVAWNAFALVHTEELIRQGKLPAELNGLGKEAA